MNQFGCLSFSLSLCQANKMCSFLDLLDFSKMQQEKKTCMWKGKLSPQTCALVQGKQPRTLYRGYVSYDSKELNGYLYF